MRLSIAAFRAIPIPSNTAGTSHEPAAVSVVTAVARDRFAHFTEQERADLPAYLRTLPGQPVNKEAAWRRLR
jgi:hypothetical protein